VELDYSAMHANLLLNKERLPSDGSFYERLLTALEIKPSKKSRGALKQIFNTSLNNESFNGFNLAAYGLTDDDDNNPERLIGILGVSPRQIYDAAVETYPPLAPYICTSKQLWKWLQHEESEIMIEVLETLAKMGIVGLPVHDSVIAPAKHVDIVKPVMSACYKKKMRFAPIIK